MKRNELIKLRRLVLEEQQKRKRIKELLENPLVLEYLERTNTSCVYLDEINSKEIIKQILEDFEVEKTNEIYVCTDSYSIDCSICYEETNYYTSNEDINSPYAEYKIYQDIENGKRIKAKQEEDQWNHYQLIKDFEREHLILNPTNKNKDDNLYQEVRLEFFQNAIEKGQVKSKRLLLEKYPRL